MESFPNEVLSALMLLVSCPGSLALLVVFVFVSFQIWSTLTRRGFWHRMFNFFQLSGFFKRHQKISDVLGKIINTLGSWVVSLLEFIGRILNLLLVLFCVLVFGAIAWLIAYGTMDPKGKGIEIFWAYVAAALIISLPLGIIFLIHLYQGEKKAGRRINPKDAWIVGGIVSWFCLTWLPAILISVPWLVVRLLVGAF